MRVLLFLLRASWRTVLLAGLVGALSGVASVALIALILRTLRAPDASTPVMVQLFAALCVVVLVTRIGSQVLLSRLTQHSVSRLRVGLCRRILDTPLQQLEGIGTHRLLASLTGDVNNIARAMNGLPGLGVNLVILICGTVYLGYLSPALMVASVVFAALGVTSYRYSARGARTYVLRAREAQDGLLKQVRGLIEGVKELKMHHSRRRAFDEQVERADALLRESQFLGDCLHDAAIIWGRLTFFIGIGLLLFAWPRLSPVDGITLTGYALTILYLMSPLEQMLAWLPVFSWATASVGKIERLGLMLDEATGDTTELVPVPPWQELEFRGVTHAYQAEGQPQGFTLGPLDFAIRAGEIVFVIGGNGSGKTTLGKLLTGLYWPDAGQICLDGQPLSAPMREGYRQLFAVVFDDAMVFDSLWGLDAADLDQQAREYLRQLELDKVVTVTDGTFSTTQLSRGQRKRLALLTAYLEDRPVYLFDEWAADQDPVFRRVFYLRLLPELKRRGKTVIAVTHDDRYFASADRVIKLEEGKIVDAFRHELGAELDAPQSRTDIPVRVRSIP
ncbi:MAG: cyclic peptide export ABC transporter [Pirellulaceae bacterium]|nr:cyclic peptide export ABC transporter [Pirellulaceae bacterium]